MICKTCAYDMQIVLLLELLFVIICWYVCVYIYTVLVLMVIVYIRWLTRPRAYTSGLDPHDDVRENIIHYDEEGVGWCSGFTFY